MNRLSSIIQQFEADFLAQYSNALLPSQSQLCTETGRRYPFSSIFQQFLLAFESGQISHRIIRLAHLHNFEPTFNT
jgi:hypothetical protein